MSTKGIFLETLTTESVRVSERGIWAALVKAVSRSGVG